MAEDVIKPKGQASDKTHARIDRAADRARQQADKAASGTKEKVAAAADRVDERVREATDAGARGAHRAADKVADWRERGSAGANNLRNKAENLYDYACDYVREKPVQSVAIALAAGWLVGRLLSSRR